MIRKTETLNFSSGSIVYMPGKLPRYIFLSLFLAGVLLIVYIQFTSGKNIDNLIKGNNELLSQLSFENDLQQIQTDIVNVENNIRGAVITSDNRHIQDITGEISAVSLDLREIKKNIPAAVDTLQVSQLEILINKKMVFFNEVLNAYKNKGKPEAEILINTEGGKELSENIFQLIDAFDNKRQQELSRITASINNNAKSAHTSGLILAALAAIACMSAFWYIVNQTYQQKKLINELNASEKRAKEAARIKENFLANMSHEIRTPLNSILGFSQLFDNTRLDADQKIFLKSIKSAGENLLNIVNDILDLSKLEAGMLRIEATTFSLRKVLQSVEILFRPKAKEKNILLLTSIDELLPDELIGDEIRLTQVLVNLAGNAIKFTNEGSVMITVNEKERNLKKITLNIKVRDTGIGIPEKKQQQVFERFEQAESETTRKYGGSGLGLSIVKQLVELQGGKVYLQSQPGIGSEFTVEITYTVNEKKKPREDPSFLTVQLNGFKTGNKILVVEDNQMNQTFLKHLLTRWNLQADIAANGNEAIDAILSANYDLVLMDIQMPGMDGYNATKKIRNELNSQIPIIAMTAHAMNGEKEKCLAEGMNDYISKPLKEDELNFLIKKYISEDHAVLPDTVIDLAYIDEISGNNSSFKKDMINQFLQQVPGDLEQIEKAIEHQNFSAINSIAHGLKTSVSFMGLLPLLENDILFLENIHQQSFDEKELISRFLHIKQILGIAFENVREQNHAYNLQTR